MAGVPKVFPFSMCNDVPGVDVPKPNFPSAFKSPDDNDIGEEPVAKSTRDARLDALNKPLLKMF